MSVTKRDLEALHEEWICNKDSKTFGAYVFQYTFPSYEYKESYFEKDSEIALNLLIEGLGQHS